MSTVIRTLQDLTVEEHTLTVPLVWGDPADHRTIDIFARVVAREGGESLPYLVFLQGGPGHEAPRPFHSSTSPAWLDEALAHYRLVLLDQRGTGLSTPVGDHDLARGAEAVAEHLTHLRADAIVRDCEAMREHLGATTWSVLGQSFGGFTTLAYLSTDAASLEDVYITGGLSAVGRHPDDVYALCYDKMRDASERYYRRFPEHRDAMRRLVDLADAGGIVLPDGEVVSRSRLRSVGSALGTNDGWADPVVDPGARSVLQRLPVRPDARDALRRPQPAVLRVPRIELRRRHATRWSAERTEPTDFRDDPTLFTGEHIRREWTETVPAFQPWRDVALHLAEFEWPSIYDAAAISASGATGAAAVYINDVYVPYEFSLETAKLLPGVQLWQTSEHEHNGLRSGPVLSHLIDLAHGRRVR